MDPSPRSDAASAATTTARAVALRFAPDSLVWGGTGLDLSVTVNANASQRLASPAEGGAATQASALGLGVGGSRFLAAADDLAFFSSEGLRLVTGGGQIQGEALARATAIETSPEPEGAQARAVNVAIGATDLLSRNGAPLWIGREADPFRAEAMAVGDGALLASARVRGLEGNPAADLGPGPTFSGQPNAVVEAVAGIQFLGAGLAGASSGALADATALEGYRLQALASGAGPGGGAQVGGRATALLQLEGLPSPGEASAADPPFPRWLASAIGIDNSTILGPARGSLRVVGEGFSGLTGSNGAGASLVGIGIQASQVLANGGNTQVYGLGGQLGASTAGFDGAGIDGSRVLLGSGEDLVVGRSLLPGSFDGIRASSVNTGLGDDTVLGSSNASQLVMGAGQDQIRLERARDSWLDGGGGNDRIVVGAGSSANQLHGGWGNDLLRSLGGAANRLDGGFGQDRLEAAGGGGEVYVQSNAGAALRAADSRAFAEQLCLPSFWNTLSSAEKEAFWSSGTWLPSTAVAAQGIAGAVDVVSGLDPARGDSLEISSSLAGITQAMWDSRGAIVALLPGESPAPMGSASVAVLSGTLADILRLGMGAPTIAYATDTRQLMFDGDGDWSQGAISIGSISLANGVEGLTKAALRFNA